MVASRALPTVSHDSPVDTADLYDLQRAAIYDPARYSCIEASTKSGKTAGCLAWLVDRAWRTGTPGAEYWWVAPSYRQAEMAASRLARNLQDAELKVRSKPPVATLPNGAVLRFLSGEKPDNLYGEDVHGAVIDEASRCRAESWYALRSTITATRAPVRMIANVTDRLNWFYGLCREAEAGKQGYAYHKLVAADAVAAGILDADEITQAKADLPAHVFSALYECVAPESGTNPFGEAAIEAALTVEECAMNSNDPYTNWFSESASEPVCWGWDVAKTTDWTVGIGMDDRRRVCRVVRFQGVSWKEVQRRIVEHTGPEAPASVDATGVGAALVDYLLADGAGRFEAFVYTGDSKQRIMEQLAVTIQSGDAISFPRGVIELELKAFAFEPLGQGRVRYSAPDGMHDDCVCALAQANALWGRAAAPSMPIKLFRRH